MAESVTSAQLAACPFPPCSARPKIFYQRAQDEFNRASSHALIESHAVGGGEWFGTCPASLMAHPIMPHERGILDNFTGMFTTMDNARKRTEQQREDNDPPPRTDQGWRKARWFRSSQGDPNGGGANAAGPRLRLVTEHDDSTQKGGAMASVSEVRAALDAANTAVAEAQAALHAASGKLLDAKAVLTAIKASTAEDLSIPVIDQALDQLDVAQQLTVSAIEINATYGATL